MIKKTLYVLIILLLIVSHVSFFSMLSFPYNNLNLILALVIFLTVLIDYKKALLLSMILGIFLEIYSPLFFGITVLTLLLTTIIINLLFIHLFTNRTFFSLLVLTFAGVATYNILILLFSYITFFFNNLLHHMVFNYKYVINGLWQLVFTYLIVIVYFFLYTSFRKYILNIDGIKTA
ncbi:hypothetical protein KKA15_06115 [Patescibacteria group bacterium]|nr:hypothetical protein [Patescibacteria group bacterium]